MAFSGSSFSLCENDIRFTEGLNMGEDMMVMMKLFICAGKVGIVHRPFYIIDKVIRNH